MSGDVPEGERDLFPQEPVDRLVGPFARFMHVEASGGVVLLAATALALFLANSPFSDAFLGLWQTKLSIGLGDFQMSHSLKHWISDGLMAVFFFVIGLEVKRELVLGGYHFSDGLARGLQGHALRRKFRKGDDGL